MLFKETSLNLNVTAVLEKQLFRPGNSCNYWYYYSTFEIKCYIQKFALGY